jgi:glycosyltransferase involved in cell wall biosynthesis
MKILLISWAFSPGRGSEPGLGWNWAWYLSREHEIWALAHPEFRADVESWLIRRPNPSLHVVWLKGTDWDPTKGQAGVTWHYLRWLKRAEQVGRTLHAEHTFDLVHHVSLNTISAPVGWWKLGVPFVWGPVGGAQVCPTELLGLFGEARWLEWVRALRLRALRHYPPFRATVAKSAAILATNHETVRFLQSAGAGHVPLIWDNGVVDEVLPERPAPRPPSPVVRVLWASRFLKRKALPLALEAVASLQSTVPLKLVIAGGGDEADRWKAMAAALRLGDRVEFLGELGPDGMRDQFRKADVFLFTSVRDSCASVVREAMTYALPVVTLDIHGVGAYMPDAAGIKVAAGPRTATVRALASALDTLATDPVLRNTMGMEGWHYAATQVWSRRAEQMSALYRRLVSTPGRGAVADTGGHGVIADAAT